MRQFSYAAVDQGGERAEARLDIVVPFTTPSLTRTALHAASRLGGGLDAGIRLIKIQITPYPLDIAQSPVPVEFLREQLGHLAADFSVDCEIRLAREFQQGLEGLLNRHSLILLATRKRPWMTRTERMAASLRRSGFTVVLVWEGNKNNA